MIKEVLILSDDFSKDMPLFDFNEGQITISGKAMPEFAKLAWIPFLEKLKEYLEKYDKLNIDFMLDFYNSSSNMYISDMFRILKEYRKKCSCNITWWYFVRDEDCKADGELYQQSFTTLNINLKKRKE